MFYREFQGVNSFLVEMARKLLKDGVPRKTRGFNCHELPYPVVIKLNKPTSRLITIPARNWNFTLPYVESLWLASGRNDIEMVAHYVKKMIDFSDDKKTMRAGYGPRFRYFTGVSNDYNNGFLYESRSVNSLINTEIDQFEFIEQSFKRDANTRQAIITIGDPAKDCFSDSPHLKETKDFPCTRDLQFINNNGKLDLIVHMRSNDFVWGASGVNLFNFTFIQEYFSQILGLEIGSYYHIVNNLHYYENLKEMVQNIADTTSYNDEAFVYSKKFKSLAEFDERLLAFQRFEYQLRTNISNELIDFDDDFFNDWAKVLHQFKNESIAEIKFSHPILNKIVQNKKHKKELVNNKKQLRDSISLDQHDNKVVYWRQYI